MIAEIYHKFSTDLEDVLTGDFFGAMRYMPFNRGLNQIFAPSSSMICAILFFAFSSFS